MKMSLRWFGPADPVPLEHIRQIPGVRGVVSALYDVPVGDAWSRQGLERLAAQVDAAGLELAVIESIPVHEDIKLGRPTRDRLVDQYCESVSRMGGHGCAGAVLQLHADLRLDADRPRDGDARRVNGAVLRRRRAGADRPVARHGRPARMGRSLRRRRRSRHFWPPTRRSMPSDCGRTSATSCKQVVPVAASANVKMAIHPDDPPWSIFGLPRIITNAAALDRLTRIVDDPANGITFCTGSLGADAANDLPAMVRSLGARGRIHFAHCRNVRRTGPRSFHESPHPTPFGDVDMCQVLRALHDTGFRRTDASRSRTHDLE